MGEACRSLALEQRVVAIGKQEATRCLPGGNNSQGDPSGGRAAINHLSGAPGHVQFPPSETQASAVVVLANEAAFFEKTEEKQIQLATGKEMKVSKGLALMALASSLTFFAAQAEAMPISPLSNTDSLVVHVADGCGAGRYRGPGGACHRFGYGPYPNGYYHPRPRPVWNGCPPGYWRGPWGHCRNTPYHGRLPGGGWQ